MSIQPRILQTLKEVDRPGEYCACGDVPFVLPGIEVSEIGELPLPLTKETAKSLIGVCRQAPYGKGTKTIVDTSVRKVWELDPEQFTFRNPAWQSCIDDIMARVQNQLGLEDRTLASHLYKLLIYETGGFFLPHKDGEKIERMVATLVVALPSRHLGGELIIRHAGKELVVRFDDPAHEFQMAFAAFYSDCEHEVRPVQSGYRLCLVYNVVLADRGKSGIGAPSYGDQIQKLSLLFERWRSENATGRLAIGLSHEYSEAGLSVQNLKGEDQSRAMTIAEAARRAGCHATLGLLTLWESGYGEDDGDTYHSSRSRYRDYQRSRAKSEYRMIEVYDSSLTANHWVAFDGSNPRFGTLTFEANQIVSDKPINDRTPEEDFEGFTGNAGMTLQRWYRQAIVVIWPQKAHYRILCSAGTEATTMELLRQARMLAGLEGDARLQQREECRRFARAILKRWRSPEYSTIRTCDVMLKAMYRIRSRTLFLHFLNSVIPGDNGLTQFRLLARSCQRIGWQICLPGLVDVFSVGLGRALNRNSKLFLALVELNDSTADRQPCLQELAATFQNSITTWALQIKLDWQDQKVDTVSLVAELIEATCRLQNEMIVQETIVMFQSLNKKFDAVSVQIPAALRVISKSELFAAGLPSPVKDWLKTLESLLADRTFTELAPPTDFTRQATLSCKCEACKQVNTFLLDPVQKDYSYRARQDLRSHLDSEIRKAKADLTTTTIRKGSPQTLLCTKNTASWKHQHDIWVQDGESLVTIRNFLASHEGPSKSNRKSKKSQKGKSRE